MKKYPKTWHLPFSEKSFSDDKRHVDDNHFQGKHVIGTIKLDGENSTLYNNHYHARSLDSNIDSEDRRWLDMLRVLKVSEKISDTMRICGENLFYQHTCKYSNLESLFYVFSIWDNDTCLSWLDTVNICSDLGLHHVPVFYDGIYDKDAILEAFNAYKENCDIGDVEGFTIRLSNSYTYDDFKISLSKFVCSSFVLPSEHWRHLPKIKNKLKNNIDAWKAF